MIWKAIPGHPDYEVSDEGKVRSYKRSSGPHEIKGRSHKRGYRLIRLRTNNTDFDRTLHSLVMEAFVGPVPEGMCVCHIDGDTTNNQLSNLRYDTLKSNQLDRTDHGTLGDKLSVRKVRVIRGLAKIGFTYKRLSQLFDVTSETIGRVVRRQTWVNVV